MSMSFQFTITSVITSVRKGLDNNFVKFFKSYFLVNMISNVLITIGLITLFVLPIIQNYVSTEYIVTNFGVSNTTAQYLRDVNQSQMRLGLIFFAIGLVGSVFSWAIFGMIQYICIKLIIFCNDLLKMDLESLQSIPCWYNYLFQEFHVLFLRFHKLGGKIEDWKCFLPPHLTALETPDQFINKYLDFDNYVTKTDSEVIVTEDSDSGTSTGPGSPHSGSSPSNSTGSRQSSGFDSPAIRSPVLSPGGKKIFKSNAVKPLMLKATLTQLRIQRKSVVILEMKMNNHEVFLSDGSTAYIDLHSRVSQFIQRTVDQWKGVVLDFSHNKFICSWNSIAERSGSNVLYCALEISETLRFKFSAIEYSISITRGKLYHSTLGVPSQKKICFHGAPLELAEIFHGLSIDWNVGIIVSEEITKYEENLSNFLFRPIDKFTTTTIPKGSDSMEVFQLMGTKEMEINEKKMRVLELYNTGYGQFFQGLIGEAYFTFSDIEENNTKDIVILKRMGICKRILERIKKNVKEKNMILENKKILYSRLVSKYVVFEN